MKKAEVKENFALTGYPEVGKINWKRNKLKKKKSSKTRQSTDETKYDKQCKELI